MTYKLAIVIGLVMLDRRGQEALPWAGLGRALNGVQRPPITDQGDASMEAGCHGASRADR